MAYLILNDEKTYAAGQTPENEKFYEFDPSDSAAISRIHTILSLRKKKSGEKSEQVLADVCTRSLEQNSSTACTFPVTSWFQTLSGYLPKFNTRNRTHNKTKYVNLFSGRISNIRFPSI